MEGLKDTLFIARAETGRSLRSARAIVLFVLFALFTALALLISGGPHDDTLAKLATATADERAAILLSRAQVLGGLYEYDPALLDAFQSIPGAILLVFKAALFFLPAYIALLGFDQLASELGSRSIRYVAVRASRSSVLFGKFLAQAAVLGTLLFAVHAAVFVYAHFVNDWFGWGDTVATLLKFWLASVLFSLTFVSLTTLCSALFRSAALSLVVNFMIIFVLLVFSAISTFGTTRSVGDNGLPTLPTITSWTGYLNYASPWHYGTNLLHPQLVPFAQSGAALCGFTAVFLLTAYAVLRARDL